MPDDPAFLEDDAPLASVPAHRAALEGLEPSRLRAILRELGSEPGRRSSGLAVEIDERLGMPGVVAGLLADLGAESRTALGLFALAGTETWPGVAFVEALWGLGVEPAAAMARPMALGLATIAPFPADPEGEVVQLESGALDGYSIVVHPAVVEEAEVTVTALEGPPVVEGAVRLVRESDGLEAVLRLAALWQLASAAPLKRTRQGDLYKRDRQRLDEDPALAGPIADAIREPIDPIAIWLNLGRAVGLVIDELDSDRTVAAPASQWAEHGVHLPQMIAARWIAGGDRPPDDRVGGPAVALRAAALLRLGALVEDAWAALDDLAGFLGARMRTPPVETRPASDTSERRRGRRDDPSPTADPTLDALGNALLGTAYLLGLVRAGEAGPAARSVVQLTPRGRYVLGLGPPPTPPPKIAQFLFVQPNFEIVAYRQGLNPALIGRLSRFARWVQLGAALTLRLTPDCIDLGLASGLTVDEVRDWLSRHAVRPLPEGVAGTIATWAGRRERLSYHTAATLIEFGTADDLEEALDDWPEGPPPVRIADRVLLVENESSIPFRRFRLAGARDYRRPPESCVQVGADGITLAADPARGDLFVEAELARFADPSPSNGDSGALTRRFTVSPASLRRASEEGLSTSGLARWFAHRTGVEMPPAIRLLAQAAGLDGGGPPGPLRGDRPFVLHATTSEILDGLLQHPSTRPLLGERLGPTAVVVRSSDPGPLREALESLGFAFRVD